VNRMPAGSDAIPRSGRHSPVGILPPAQIPAGEPNIPHTRSLGPPSPQITQALLDLNRAGLLVNEDGELWLRGEIVRLRVRDGTMVAIVNGLDLPWRVFRQALPRTR
jgi:hypothetical protein